MYLLGNTNWWWTRSDEDAIVEHPFISLWEIMKQELWHQFLPWQAHEALGWLKQTSTIRDYVKAFIGHLFEIKNISEDDKLFNFMDGYRTGPKYILVATKRLINYCTTPVGESNKLKKQVNGKPRTMLVQRRCITKKKSWPLWKITCRLCASSTKGPIELKFAQNGRTWTLFLLNLDPKQRHNFSPINRWSIKAYDSDARGIQSYALE